MHGCLQGNIRYDGSLDKSKFRILVIVDLHNKEIIGDTWSMTASMRTLKYLLVDYFKNKAGVYQLDFIGSFIKSNVKHRVL